MVWWIWAILVFGAVWFLAARRATIFAWSAAALAGFGLWAWGTGVSLNASGVGLLALLVIFLPLNLPTLRRVVFTNHILSIFRKKMPPMSRTEREALEAGTVWWDAALFSGQPDWEKLLETPAPSLSQEELAFLDGPTEELCRMLDDWRIHEHDHDLSPEVWRYIKEKGFFGMIIPKQYGGLEFSALAHSSVVMKLASRSVPGAVTVMVPNSLGPAELLLHYGTEAQKDYYLPRLARGEEVPCFALTGIHAGSDAASMTDTGVVCRGTFRGQEDVLGIRLNWEKRYITLGPIATVLGLAFKLYDPDCLLSQCKEPGITLALIPTDTPGVHIGRRHSPSNIAFQNGPNSGRDVFIPLDWVIGGAARAGQGWRMLMECLAAGRAISLPALGTGLGKLASRTIGAYARVRKQFRTAIGRFEGVEEALARIGGYTYLMESARCMTAGALDQGEKPSVISAIVKYHLTEHMRRVVNDAMDVQGGKGICMGPRNFMARAYQAIPISITVEGANILTRSLIIFGQGAIRCHPYILEEMRAASDPDSDRASKQFDQVLSRHASFLFSNAARVLFHGVTGSRLVRVPFDTPMRRTFQHMTRMSAVLALASDISMLVLGGSLKRRENLSARLGDVLSHLYLASACLKRFHDQGCPDADRPLVRWACAYSLHTIQERLVALIRNFPNRPVRWILRLLIFPTGRPFPYPEDHLSHQLAQLLLKPSEARDRLTVGIFIPDSPREGLGPLEKAFASAVAAEPAELKLRQAARAGNLDACDEAVLLETALQRGWVNQEEAAVMQRAITNRGEAIQVDDYPPDYWTNGNGNGMGGT